MAARAHIGNESTAAIEFKVQCRFIRAITDDEIELRQRLLAAPLTATTNELLTIAKSYYKGTILNQHQKHPWILQSITPISLHSVKQLSKMPSWQTLSCEHYHK